MPAEAVSAAPVVTSVTAATEEGVMSRDNMHLSTIPRMGVRPSQLQVPGAGNGERTVFCRRLSREGALSVVQRLFEPKNPSCALCKDGNGGQFPCQAKQT